MPISKSDVFPTRQRRSQDTQRALLDAGLELFMQEGFDRASMAKIARKAGCAVGSCYRRFKNKEALFRAVYMRLSDSLEVSIRQLDASLLQSEGSLHDQLVNISQGLFQQVSAHRIFLQMVLIQAKSDPVILQRVNELRRQAKQVILELILSFKDYIGHPDPELAAGFAVEQAMAVSSYRIELGGDAQGGSEITDQQFLQEMVNSIVAYLAVDMSAAVKR